MLATIHGSCLSRLASALSLGLAVAHAPRITHPTAPDDGCGPARRRWVSKRAFFRGAINVDALPSPRRSTPQASVPAPRSGWRFFNLRSAASLLGCSPSPIGVYRRHGAHRPRPFPLWAEVEGRPSHFSANPSISTARQSGATQRRLLMGHAPRHHHFTAASVSTADGAPSIRECCCRRPG